MTKHAHTLARVRTVTARQLLALSIGLAACVDPPAPTTQSGSTGAEGGSVVLEGTAAVQVGRGALAAPITVTVATAAPPVAVPAPTVSKVVEFTPHGTTFGVPAKISLAYDSASPVARLKVLRLSDANATTWTPVGGVHFEQGVATFETTTFSFYTVTDGFECVSPGPALDCSSSCECCGTASCVDLTTSPGNCKTCGTACAKGEFCAASACVATASTSLCENASIHVITGELPNLTAPDPAHTPDAVAAASIAGALATKCGVTPVFVPQAQAGILDPCTDAPLLKGGNTILLFGGTYTQRLARYLEQGLSPMLYDWNETTSTLTFTSRGGTTIGSYPLNTVTPRHDYFGIAFIPDPVGGALIIHIFGMGEEGTPAGAWYFNNTVIPEITAGTRTWQRYVLVEWTDDGDGIKNAADTYKILGKDVP